MDVPGHLIKRHTQSAIVSKMVLVIYDCMREVYQRKPSLNAMLEEMVIACLIRRNDFDGNEPMKATQISKATGIPRTNVNRAADIMINSGIVKKERGGFTSNLEFLEEKKEAEYFKNMLTAIHEASRELRELE